MDTIRRSPNLAIRQFYSTRISCAKYLYLYDSQIAIKNKTSSYENTSLIEKIWLQ